MEEKTLGRRICQLYGCHREPDKVTHIGSDHPSLVGSWELLKAEELRKLDSSEDKKGGYLGKIMGL